MLIGDGHIVFLMSSINLALVEFTDRGIRNSMIEVVIVPNLVKFALLFAIVIK